MTKNVLKAIPQEKNMLQEVSEGLGKIYDDLVVLNKEIQTTYEKISIFNKKGRRSYVAE